MDKLAISENKIVFEITERTAINDMVSFKEILDNYHSQGYMVAIDDAGAGYSGLKTIHEVRPHLSEVITALKKKTKLAGKSAYCIEKIDAK